MGHGVMIIRDSTVAANKDLMGAVEDYFKLNLSTQKLCTSLREFVKKARDDQIIIDRALAIKEVQISLSEQDCKEIIEEFRSVRGELICAEEFESVYKRHAEMQSQLGMVKRKVDKKIKYYKRLMKGWSIAAALVKRLSSLRVESGLQNACEGDGLFKSEFVLVKAMSFGTFMSCKDVESMRVLVDRLHGELGRTATSIQFGERRGDSSALLLSLQDIHNKQPEFLKHLKDFERQTYVCNTTISKAGAVVLQKLGTRLIH